MKGSRGAYILTVMLLLVTLTACSAMQPVASTGGEGTSSDSPKTELVVSAAASLTDAMNELKGTFEQEHPQISLVFNFGSSGKLARQIEQGAPSDLFLSASQKDMDTLDEKQLIDKDSRVDFAANRLVLIAAVDSPLPFSSIEQIDPEQFQHLAIGEPEIVPAGRYAKDVLQSVQLWVPLQEKLVLGSDVRQVLTYVATGNAELGIVYASDATIADGVKVLAAAKQEWHQPIVYPAAIVSSSAHRPEAELFLDYLTSEAGKAALKKYGFE
ncbi:molybdate ABC transporter substrate-binding protein [Brevibacillus humidisoli]|uniref:molybdate ABC transporter substrate-binding protein n=1 Tax=Brevibacillus humidisoli TaxID=2895522 RepID=UPI001E471EA3|nr:molybdate ABC transporter substrate-binding protein [Brevibacillus humidisoli]UFJ39597.1 molybdate ABC transporter substrate-binding protein [Brevibacillus humidisoli]